MIRIPQPNRDRDEPPFSAEADLARRVNSAAAIACDPPPIREGSPFAEGSAISGKALSSSPAIPISAADHGPAQYTAVGALVACVVVLGFAIPSAIWFPAGGLVITALGLGLALFGMQSGRVRESLALIALNLALFLYCVVSL